MKCKCNRCKSGFDYAEAESKETEEGIFLACPVCHSFDIEDAVECEMCGEILYPWNLKNGICQRCLDLCVDKYRAKLAELEDDVIEALENEFGEIDITKR